MRGAATLKNPSTDAMFVHREGSGEPLVLLHGMGESHIGWRPVIDPTGRRIRRHRDRPARIRVAPPH